MAMSDIISKSDLIQSGSPTVYQLRTKKKNIGDIRRVIFCEKKNVNKINKTILLVGETGVGKSTLINTLVNFAIGVKWEDDVWFQIVQDEKKDQTNTQTKSQTLDVTVYQVFGFEGKTLPFSLTIIDTPGYGSTGGNEKDSITRERLLQLFRSGDGVHEINAVGLVMKATENQVSDRLRYIFDSVMSLFGKNMEKNIVALITHSDGTEPVNVLKALEDVKIKLATDEDMDPVYFLFNNNQSTQKTKKNMNALKSAWDLTTEGICELAAFLEKESAQDLKETVEVLKSHVRLTDCIQNLKERIRSVGLKQKEIQQIQEALKKFEEEMKNNEKFTVEVDEPYKDKEDIRGGWWGLGLFYEGAVCCTVCEETCHYPGCTLAKRPSGCDVMKRGHCTSCTNKCPASDHVKEEWIYVIKTRKATKTLDDVKQRYEENKAGSLREKSLLECLQTEMENLQKEKDQLLEDSFNHVVKLEEIALNSDSASIRVHLDYLIDGMKEKGDTAKVQKLEEIKSRVEKDEGKLEAMSYGFRKLWTGGKK